MTETLLLAGTRKGLFLARQAGGSWHSEPMALPMTAVYAVAIDTRGATPRLFASATSEHWGPTVLHSDDLGATWSEPDHAPATLPDDAGAALERIWQIQPGRTDEPGVVYAGAEPAALFRSIDHGVSFELVQSLWDHPHRGEWGAGAGGQAIHTILPHPLDPDRTLIALSSGGCYRTFDGGRTWTPANQGIKVTFLPDPPQFPEFGQCVHKVAQDSADPDRLYLQNHNGVYRSDDWGGEWTSIADGLPGEFGFTVLADPNAGGGAYVIPLVSDGFRFAPEFRCRVYGTRDAGGSWSELVGTGTANDTSTNTNTLPGPDFYSLVLRDAFATDGAPTPGFYFGTRDGCLYASGPQGWTEVASHLPDVLSVRAAVIG